MDRNVLSDIDFAMNVYHLFYDDTQLSGIFRKVQEADRGTLNVRSGTVSCFRWSDSDLGGAEAKPKRNSSLGAVPPFFGPS